MFSKILAPALLFALITATPDAALAYIGPGAGLSAIGTLAALVAAMVLAIVGFVWYPVKRMLKGRNKAVAGSDSEVAPSEQ